GECERVDRVHVWGRIPLDIGRVALLGRWPAAMFAAVLLCVCATDVRIQRSRPPGAEVRIARGERLYIMRAADGAYRGRIYPGSGDELVKAAVGAFATHTSA